MEGPQADESPGVLEAANGKEMNHPEPLEVVSP